MPFYREVFGLTTSTMNMGAGDYTLFLAGDAQVGGTTPPTPSGTPNHWRVYFAVASADEAAAKITELGGEVLAKPFDTPAGRMGQMRDPQGAVFSIVQPPAAQS